MSADFDIIRRIGEVAASQPGAPAIRGADHAVTYGDCQRVVAELADALAATVTAGQCVGLSVRKSPQAILLMLACLRAEIPYVPIDPSAPARRREQIRADADPALLFVSAETTGNWPNEEFTTLDALSGTWSSRAKELVVTTVAVARRGRAEPSAEIAANELAYVLYTSGSTGTPKGVMISRTNAGYFVDWATRAFPLSPADQVAQHAPLHFDLPVYDVFGALVSGACLHLMDERTVMMPAAAYRLLREREITALYAVPSALTLLLRRSALRADGLPRLRQLLYAGEEFHLPPLRALVATLPERARVANLYGPVETNVITWAEMTPTILAGARVPIGRAVPGSDVRALRADGTLADRSAEGELVVSGPSVSPGYLNDQRRTRESRLRATVDGVSRVYYRTGDFARVDDTGTWHFQGRRDGMVKIRGFRVELGDVESAILAHPMVAHAAVSPATDADGGTVLEAHVVVDEQAHLTAAALRRWVTEQVPAYMVPATVTLHDELPLTSTGKIARTELGGQR